MHVKSIVTRVQFVGFLLVTLALRRAARRSKAAVLAQDGGSDATDVEAHRAARGLERLEAGGLRVVEPHIRRLGTRRGE
jgi:hypothetical protein